MNNAFYLLIAKVKKTKDGGDTYEKIGFEYYMFDRGVDGA